MHKIIILSLILFFSSVTFAQKVQVLSGVTPPKKQEIAIYPTPQKLEIDDEMLPTSTDYYLFEVCVIGQEEILVQAQQEKPALRGEKAGPNQYKIKNYRPVRRCKDYVGTNTPLDKRNMIQTATQELHVPNGRTVTMNLKASLGNPHAMFVVIDKAAMPYTVPYDEMPKGSVLKKILKDPGKIEKFYSYNLPASIYLNSVMQKRFYYKERPIRISFYEYMLGNGQSRTFIVFVFNEAEKYTYQPALNENSSDKVYDITPDFAVQYLK